MVEVRSARVRPTRRRRLRIVEVTVADPSGPLKAIWFNQAWLADRLKPGTRLLLNGRLERSGFRVEAHEIVGEAAATAPVGIHTTGLVPVHPAGEGLRANRIREWAWQALEAAPLAIEPLPAELRARGRRTAHSALPRGRGAGAPGPRAAGARGAGPSPGGAGDPPPGASRVATRDRARAGKRARRSLA